MPKKTFRESVEFYLGRFAYQKPEIKGLPNENTRTIVTIPCHNEPNLLDTLNSLLDCDLPEKNVEVIVIINASENASKAILGRNQKTFDEISNWIKENSSKKLVFHILENNKLPKKDAGVGLARKIVMDEALARFASIDFDGTILCLDSDCIVKKNYLQVIEKSFEDSKIKSASIYFEHLPAENLDLEKGILNYELFLRYYVQGLKYAGYPFAFHTIGSSMAVRASTYALSGGMNRRKAGEDFYFLHKVSHLGKLQEITDTSILPSSRISNRVPFGTGKAQEKWLQNSERIFKTYDVRVFEELKVFFSLTKCFFQISEDEFRQTFQRIPKGIQMFLGNSDSFWEIIRNLNQRTKQMESFHKRYFNWLDGLKILKIVHFLRDNFYKEIDICKASEELLNKLGYKLISEKKIIELLKIYRGLDKKV